MGTRCLTFVYDEDGSALINMYRQYDGYPSGHGMELAEFLAGKTLVNGIPSGVDESTLANGMGCLAAWMIAKFKTTAGGIYIYSVDSTDCWQDYEYHVYPDKIVVKSYSEILFEGSWDAFKEFCSKDSV